MAVGLRGRVSVVSHVRVTVRDGSRLEPLRRTCIGRAEQAHTQMRDERLSQPGRLRQFVAPLGAPASPSPPANPTKYYQIMLSSPVRVLPDKMRKNVTPSRALSFYTFHYAYTSKLILSV